MSSPYTPEQVVAAKKFAKRSASAADIDIIDAAVNNRKWNIAVKVNAILLSELEELESKYGLELIAHDFTHLFEDAANRKLEEKQRVIDYATEILKDAPELNMANYNECEVSELNDASIQAYLVLVGKKRVPKGYGKKKE